MTVQFAFVRKNGDRGTKEFKENSKFVYLKNQDIAKVDLAPLSKFTEILGLSLEGNALESIDLSPVGSCTTLRDLALTKNSLSSIDLTPLASHPNLRKVLLGQNKLKEANLKSLGSCPSLQELQLDNNMIENIDLEPLGHCANFETLSLSANRLETIDLSPLRHCAKLRKLTIEGNNLSDLNLSPLSGCTDFQALLLSKNRLKNINLEPLAACTKLEVLETTDNRLESLDLSPLGSCTNLRWLILDRNQLEELDLAPLEACKNLQRLLATSNKIRSIDLSPLRLCFHLEKLDFQDNNIEVLDYAPLEIVWHKYLDVLVDSSVRKLNRWQFLKDDELFEGEGLVETRHLLKDALLKHVNQYLIDVLGEKVPAVLVSGPDNSIKWGDGEWRVAAPINPAAHETIIIWKPQHLGPQQVAVLTNTLETVYDSNIRYIEASSEPSRFREAIAMLFFSHFEGRVLEPPQILCTFVFNEDNKPPPVNRLADVPLPTLREAEDFFRETLEAAHRLLSGPEGQNWVDITDDYLAVRYLLHRAGLGPSKRDDSRTVDFLLHLAAYGKSARSQQNLWSDRGLFADKFREMMQSMVGEVKWSTGDKSYSFHLEISKGAPQVFILRCKAQDLARQPSKKDGAVNVLPHKIAIATKDEREDSDS